MRFFIWLAWIFIVVPLLSCAQEQNFQKYMTPPTGSGPSNTLELCSALDFTGVTWSLSVSSLDQGILMLALNISGSFEGVGGWANITNNFDGQGMSLGLLNQNLGQGSLQPLLQQMLNSYKSKMQSLFSSTHFKSLEEMLKNYGAVPITISSINQKRLSPLDGQGDLLFPQSLGAKEAASVQWAVDNIYSNSQFVPLWKSEFVSMASSWEYISIQVAAAQKIHERVKKNMADLSLIQVRSYLMLFDIEVQNGGFYSSDIQDYQSFLRSNPSSNEGERLHKLLELRLRHVLPQYVDDVMSRKMALIQGSGVVHGAFRHLENQYCFQRLVSYR